MAPRPGLEPGTCGLTVRRSKYFCLLSCTKNDLASTCHYCNACEFTLALRLLTLTCIDSCNPFISGNISCYQPSRVNFDVPRSFSGLSSIIFQFSKLRRAKASQEFGVPAKTNGVVQHGKLGKMGDIWAKNGRKTNGSKTIKNQPHFLSN